MNRPSKMELEYATFDVAVIGGGAIGSSVAEPKVDQGLDRLFSFSEFMIHRGLKPGSKLLAAEVQRVSAVDSPLLSSLHLKLGERVISLSRLRLGNGQPLVIALIYLPEHLFPHFLERDLNSRSVYEIMDAYGLKPTEAAQTFQAVALAKEEAKLFGVSPGLPELLIVRTGYAGAVPVEYAVDYYRGDRTKFRIALTDVSVRRELHFHME